MQPLLHAIQLVRQIQLKAWSENFDEVIVVASRHERETILEWIIIVLIAVELLVTIAGHLW